MKTTQSVAVHWVHAWSYNSQANSTHWDTSCYRELHSCSTSLAVCVTTLWSCSSCLTSLKCIDVSLEFSPFICKCLHQSALYRSVHIGTHTLQESPHQLLKVQTHKVLMNETNACIQLYWMCVYATHGIIHMHCQHYALNFKVHAAMAADQVHSCACRLWTIAIVNAHLDHALES